MTAPGGFVAGDILGAADMNALPGGVMAYGAATSTQTSISTSFTDLTGVTVTFTAVAGRRYLVTANVRLYGSAANVHALVNIYNTTGAAELQSGGALTGAAAGGGNNDEASTVHLEWSGEIAAGSTTLKVQAKKGATGTGTLTSLAAATQPAFILVEDIGAA